MVKTLENPITLIENALIKHLAKDGASYENGEITATSAMREHLDGAVYNVKVFEDRINTFNNKLEDPSLDDEQRDVYHKAIKLVKDMMYSEIFMDKVSAKSRYEKEHNIYNCLFYIEVPLHVLGFDDSKHTVATMFFSDIPALNKNLNFAKRLSGCKHAMEILKGETQTDEDMYEQFKKSDNKVEFVRNSIEFSHILIGELPNCYGNNYVIKGKVDKTHTTKYKVTLLTDNPEKLYDYVQLTTQAKYVTM